MRAPVIALAIASFIGGCAGDSLDQVPNDPPRSPDAGTSVETTPLKIIREDFANQELIEATTKGVLVDVNTGMVRLETRRFPELLGDPLKTFEHMEELNGIVAADQILISSGGGVRASDSIELIAKDFVRVIGEISAGPGGVTIAAGKNIIIEGSINSRGPVRLMLANAQGTIRIKGSIRATSGDDLERSAAIEVLGRGKIDIEGVIRTESRGLLPAGSITFDTYGDIRIAGPGQIASIAPPGGANGALTIRSESKVEIVNDASIGETYGVDPLSSSLATAGDISIQAQEVIVGDHVNIVASSALENTGARVMIKAGKTFTTGSDSWICGGTGRVGGDVSVHVEKAIFGPGSEIKAGTGFFNAGTVLIEASSALEMMTGASLVGGDGICGDGGKTSVFVAGDLALAPEFTITGGNGGGTELQPSCSLQTFHGGAVEVVARSFSGEGNLSSIKTGTGAIRSDRSVRADPMHAVDAPTLSVSAFGSIESKVIDRGSEAIGEIPVLRELTVPVRPEGTLVKLELSTATHDGDVATWFEAVLGDLTSLEELRNERYFRYRLTMIGRAFDTPVVDYFEIDLAPLSNASRNR
jgi:hypothetical protein